MASKAMGGFDNDFVEPPPQYLECPICLLILCDPHVTSCCGNQICHPCIQRIQRDGKPCPLCNEPNFTSFLHKGVTREVNALLVRCPQKELGCQWVGELGKLQQHLSPSTGVKGTGDGCGYVEVECAYECGGRFYRHTIHEHELEFCPNRPVEAQLSSATRKLSLALTENLSLKEDIAQVKEMQEQEIGKLTEKLEAALQVIREETNKTEALKNELAELKQAQDQQKMATAEECQSLTREVNRLKQTQEEHQKKFSAFASQTTPVPPFLFSVRNYHWWKREKIEWRSPPFYSHPDGYKMQVSVDVGARISLHVLIMRGEHDNELQWPFQGNVTLQLFNRKAGSWDFERTLSFLDADSICSRRPPEDCITNAAPGIFIVTMKELEAINLNLETVRFRVAKVEL